MEPYRDISGIELHSRSIPPLALQQTGGRVLFTKDHDEVGMWPLGPGDIGIRAGFVVHAGLQPLNTSDKWTDGYLLNTSLSLSPSAATLTLISLDPLVAQYVSDGAGGMTVRHVLKHGWQSWSGTGSFTNNNIDYDPPSRFMRLLTTNPARPAPGKKGLFSSEMFTVIRPEKGRGAILCGFLDPAYFFTDIQANFVRGGRGRIACRINLDGIPLRPGEDLRLPTLLVAFGQNEIQLLEAYMDMTAQYMKARVPQYHLSVWSSSNDCQSQTGDAAQAQQAPQAQQARTEDLLANLAVGAGKSKTQRDPDNLVITKGALIDVFQIGDGYQAQIGNWLEHGTQFPNGMPYMVTRIKEAGLRPGIWLAPFLAAPNAPISREHPDWLLRNSHGRPITACINPKWNSKRLFALDPTHPEVLNHLVKLFETLTQDWGFEFIEADYLYAAALPAARHNPIYTDAGALRLGLEAIRRGCGEQVFLLTSGCPISPAIGIADGMSIAPDCAPFWSNRMVRKFGNSFNLRSMENATRNTITRSYMHRRLWLNVPGSIALHVDEVDKPRLTAEEVRSFATAAAVLGGITTFSEDSGSYDPERWKICRQLIAISKDQPVGPAGGSLGASMPGSESASESGSGSASGSGPALTSPSAPDLLSNPFPSVFRRSGLHRDYLALFNNAAFPHSMAVDLEKLFSVQTFPKQATDFWTGEKADIRGSILEMTVPPHGCRLFLLPK